MLPHVLERITAADLQGLIDQKIPEGKTIDYKKALYHFDSDKPEVRTKQHQEFLKDVSSFANTVGGDLLIGVDEDEGVPTKLVGLDGDMDKLKLRLIQLLESWLEPRVGCSMYPVPIEGGRHVLVIRIPRSLLSPHRVIYANEFGQFWARNSGGAYAMDTSELRQAFTLTQSTLEKIDRFVHDRVRLLTGGVAPVLMPSCAKMILHLVPLESFAARMSFTPDELKSPSGSLEPLSTQHRSHRINMDGLILTTASDFTKQSLDYVQLFRNGIVEVVSGDITFQFPDDPEKNPYLRTHHENYLVQKLPKYLEYLKTLGIPLPVFLFLTLTGIRGVRIHLARHCTPMPPFDRDRLELPDIQIEDYSTDALHILRPLFDMIWNAGGYPRCLSFNDKGEWHNAS